MNCPDWEQDGEDCREFEENAAAMRDLNVPPAAFAAVRQRVLSEIQAKKRRTVWFAWPAVAAAACLAMLCVAYLLPSAQRPAAIWSPGKDPPRIEWTLAQPVVAARPP
jgi:ferric-dicitrate binding protein FerR (iron transport regulator)